VRVIGALCPPVPQHETTQGTLGVAGEELPRDPPDVAIVPGYDADVIGRVHVHAARRLVDVEAYHRRPSLVVALAPLRPEDLTVTEEHVDVTGLLGLYPRLPVPVGVYEKRYRRDRVDHLYFPSASRSGRQCGSAAPSLPGAPALSYRGPRWER